jgi:predicted HTH domain antitoxin
VSTRPNYEPHYLGPYSETLENTLNSLVRLGYIEAEDSNFHLTQKGIKIFKSLTPKPELVRVIDDFKSFINDLSDNEILTFIYTSYPEYISESVKWDELKPRRVEFAISLLRNDKVSFGKAAEIAGISQIEFDRVLKKRNLRWRE